MQVDLRLSGEIYIYKYYIKKNYKTSPETKLQRGKTAPEGDSL